MNAPLTVNDLPFIDLYVRLDAEDQAYYRSKERGKSTINQLVPPEFAAAVTRFAAAVNLHLGTANDGSIDFEGVRCRLSRQDMADGTNWVCARRINTIIPDLEKLGIMPQIFQHMQTLGKRDGLIMVSGATGHGKTTTAVALLAYFLRTYGGAAVTIEDPVEFMMRGRHGDGGQCFQVEVHKEEDWAVCLKRALRWAPRYIYVGEIRTPKAAEQLLRAATTGHLVITTVHAGSPEEALMGLIFLAEQAMGPGVQNILAAGLTSVIYQTMRETGPSLRYLFTEPDSPGDPIRSLIRENKIGMLSTYIDRIAARLVNPAFNAANMQASPLSGKK
jgi:twitching motility protein PilT